MSSERAEKFIRLEKIVPELPDTQYARGLRFNNGRYGVAFNTLNGRGAPVGRRDRAASFVAPELAESFCRFINRQDPRFRAQVEVDERIDEGDPVQEMLERHWDGEMGWLAGPYYVAASFLDCYGRCVGGGAVCWFKDKGSAQTCADMLNRENLAYEAEVVEDEAYPQTIHTEESE